ncbi:MAG TPA: flagellar biosynthetic protein FliP, partial [Stellaceae bacterium]|nr:flagellar biosynthetic protein FliP [Stellaceae bacterium]
MRTSKIFFAAAGLIVLPAVAYAAPAGLDALIATPTGHGAVSYTVPIQILLFMTGLVFLPAVLLAMTSFTRIIIVLSLLRQALGLTQT